MVAGDIIDFDALAHPFDEFVDDAHMGLRPIPLAELPHINDIAVQHDHLGFYAAQII